MRVLVTGAKGMLGKDVCLALSRRGHIVLASARRDSDFILDVTDLEDCGDLLRKTLPDAVIHCAAYTAVDAAETDQANAFRVNALAPGYLAHVCADLDIPICTISTDFVFDGEQSDPYTEFDCPRPLGVYGASKLAGENAVRDAWRKHWIVRTSWLFGLHGKCFPDTIIKTASQRPELKVVSDQIGTPTFTLDLANSLADLIQTQSYGTYHVANSGEASWHEFADAAVRLAGLQTPVRPILTIDWPTAAKRPSNSRLRCYRFELEERAILRPWQEALQEYVSERLRAGSAS